jgi:hypothetical protein
LPLKIRQNNSVNIAGRQSLIQKILQSMWLKRLVHLFAAGTAVSFPMAPKAPGGKDKGAQDMSSSADAKIHCDEAAGHLKTGNYTKALNGYNLVSTHSSDDARMSTTPQGPQLHKGSYGLQFSEYSHW